MACKIILVRHGQSEGNSKSVFCGHHDLDLTKLGYKQAERTCDYLKNRKIDKIYSSDLLRAYNTSLPLSKALGLEVIKTEGMREIFAGDWEGQSVSTLTSKFAENFNTWMYNIGLSRPQNGESVLELQARIKNELTRLALENDGKTIAVFTHATPIRVLFAAIRGAKPEEIKDIPWASNASVSEVVFDNGVFSELAYSIDDFMGDMVTYISFPKKQPE